jgi:hypothetical protein
VLLRVPVKKAVFQAWFSEVDGLMRAQEMSTKPLSMFEKVVP